MSVAGYVLRFVDFGLKATSKAREIFKSVDGALPENIDIETLTEDNARVEERLEASAGATTGCEYLCHVCTQCTLAAEDLLGALRSLRVEGKKNRWKSAMWGKKRVEKLREKLLRWTDEIQFYVLSDRR